MENKLHTQQKKQDFKDKFKRNFYISPQDGFVLCNLGDVRDVFNFVQQALLFELHHQMIITPKRPNGDMPSWYGPYEIELACLGEEYFDNYIFVDNSRAYLREIDDIINLQFYVKRVVDLKFEENIKAFCRNENIGLRYLDSSFFVECHQIWLEDRSNTNENKEKLREFIWNWKTEFEKTDSPYAKELPYKKEKIVFYDDVLQLNQHVNMDSFSEEVSPENSYNRLIENVLKNKPE